MTAEEIRRRYLQYQEKNGHIILKRAKVVPEDDPTTLFTGSGMQQLLPYLLGKKHPDGVRLADVQTCVRAQDIEDVGDNRHTTFFEMLGNWSLGDYFKNEQLPWIYKFLTDEVGLDPKRIYITCYNGNEEYGIPRDDVSANIWKKLLEGKGIDTKEVIIGPESNGYNAGMQGGRIFFYNENWWSRGGNESNTPIGDPCGPDSEMMYEFPEIEHDKSFGEFCHPACDCGRYMEIGNSVFMTYKRTEDGFELLDSPNVDFGGGLERIAAASIDSPDIFKISLLFPIIEKLEKITSKSYLKHKESMRVMADHLRAACFMAVDGVTPSNKEAGYVMRRLVRRAIVRAHDLGIEQNFFENIVPSVVDIYEDDYPEVKENRQKVIDILLKEEKVFRQTLRKGLKVMTSLDGKLSGDDIFTLYDTYGFPVELSTEEAKNRNINLSENWQQEFDNKMTEQRERSKTAAKGVFKGGLGGQTLQHKKYHTATHLMYQALRDVLGDHVVQRGSNITEDRLRFDFSHPEKMTPEQIEEVEKIVNDQIAKDLKITWAEYPTEEATGKLGALGQFGDRYGDTVKVYSMKDPNSPEDERPFSFEICGGPHVEHTLELIDGNKKFKIQKEESSSSGIRRIKAVLI